MIALVMCAVCLFASFKWRTTEAAVMEFNGCEVHHVTTSDTIFRVDPLNFSGKSRRLNVLENICAFYTFQFPIQLKKH